MHETYRSLGRKVTLVAWLLLSIDVLVKGGLYFEKKSP
jgi:hypothetical protein